MSQEPTYPADAVPGRATPAAANDSPAPVTTVTPSAADASSRRWQMAGVGAAIGSAAIAAALLYTNRPKRD